MYSKATGERLNIILGKKIFKNISIDNATVKNKTGLTIEQLILSSIFSSRNNFKAVLNEWIGKGKLMNFEEIQRGF